MASGWALLRPTPPTDLQTLHTPHLLPASVQGLGLTSPPLEPSQPPYKDSKKRVAHEDTGLHPKQNAHQPQPRGL